MYPTAPQSSYLLASRRAQDYEGPSSSFSSIDLYPVVCQAYLHTTPSHARTWSFNLRQLSLDAAGTLVLSSSRPADATLQVFSSFITS